MTNLFRGTLTLPMREAAQELSVLPGRIARAGLSTLAALEYSLFRTHAQAASRKPVSIAINGGAILPPFFYNVTRDHLRNTLGNIAHIRIPHQPVISIDGVWSWFSMAEYLWRLALGDQIAEYQIGHSIGGVASIIALGLWPDKVRKVYLGGTPIRSAHARHPLI
ncbi:MAG: hypothetical protein AAB372_02845 [Patescibacteria group bacterium]